ncbi:MAG: GerMN domain-containing protein [Bacillota bacterium]
MNTGKIAGIITSILVIAISLFFITKMITTPPSPPLPGPEGGVKLYFTTDNALYLQGEERSIQGDNIYLKAIEELIAGPESSSLGPTIPRGVRVLELRMEGKTVFIDFNTALRENHWGGSTGERMTVYSIVNTLTQFPGIDEVQILLEGENINTLVGHMDLSGPLKFNQDILKKEAGNED